ncbi:bifunctional folylpolyglutamate synthase/dihydrofolate synthase [Lacticaseibacillus brantae]|uniref:tetrahydrofolate synthase n=1 Tax=Lacticaseibacillus brantae DSM 23927 TaxID=1423727 RepID=A0A0R2B814_9LACO|nr:folylpolyglutamate synthase/dihydrofolate synthase family protein [Lacticaseibacillus brantae]KRM72489.1 hypothetical protein FC34_GL000195 [Lacticaseibacillus brantae DSM 23927]
MQTYDETLAYIHDFPRLAKTGDLHRIERLLEALDHPESQTSFVHVTGTNGKGSTANMISHILEASGLTVGLFTSPFIMCFNERLMIDHQPISDDDLVRLTDQVKTALTHIQDAEPDFIVTEFEFVTALGLLYFAQQAVDVAVIEVGIGGLEDSTNVILPKVAVITEVALDHQNMLGDTLSEIARHKAGIIKAGVPVVTGDLVPEAMRVVEQTVKTKHSQWLALNRDFSTEAHRLHSSGQEFKLRDAEGTLPDIALPLIGQYQIDNAAIAIEAAKVFAQGQQWPLNAREIRRGLSVSQWPGRFEVINDDPIIILDGAHNPDGIDHLTTAVKTWLPQQPVVVIAGMLADKAFPAMAQRLATLGPLYLVPVPDNPRAATGSDYDSLEAGTTMPNWQSALAEAMTIPDGVILVTGSLYLVAAVRQTLLGESGDD